MENKIYFQNRKGEKLVGLLSNPLGDINKPIIILAHGHSTNKNSKNIVKISEILNEKKVSTFRIDLYGHGESEGNLENATVSSAVESILSAILYLKSNGYNKIGLVGSSYGGIASTLAASKTSDLFVLVLKSPVSDYNDLYTWRKTPIDEWNKNGYIDYDTSTGPFKLGYSFYEDAIQNSGYAVASGIQIPTLIVHGNADDEVNFEQSIKLSKLIPNSTLDIIEGADHTYTNPKHAQEMIDAIVNFLMMNI